MIMVLVISIGFLVPKAAAPQPGFVTKIMHSPRPSPSTGEGTRQRAQRRECTPMTTQTSVLLRNRVDLGQPVAARLSRAGPDEPPEVLVLYLKRPRAKRSELRGCVVGASDTALRLTRSDPKIRETSMFSNAPGRLFPPTSVQRDRRPALRDSAWRVCICESTGR
jgi:hypothetical protein